PPSPDLTEQRIGRLDRIGQTETVKIHIPLLEASVSHALFRWFHEGLQLFEAPNAIAQSIFEPLLPEFEALLGIRDATCRFPTLDELIAHTRELNQQKLAELHRGRDRLLELNSHRPHISAGLVEDIRHNEGGEELLAYMEKSFDAFGLESDDLGDGVFVVKPGDTMVRNFAVSLETQDHYHYPELPEDGVRFTCSRETALAREDVAFFTWENPLVQQALDRVTAEPLGNSTMIVIRHPGLKTGTVLMETLYVAECLAPRALMADRYLPPTVLRQVIAPNLLNLAPQLPFDDFESLRLDIGADALHKILDSQLIGLKKMLEKAGTLATAELGTLVQSARERADRQLQHEAQRLRSLARTNEAVRPEEIAYLETTREQLLAAIDSSDIRLDAVRVIVCA
ncbi:MAG: hypothetical protein KDI36_20355, partial [Pseudomonadales bacterium]|nr:hypothetical protein [Pseudomonadales bacterium]